MVAGHTRITRYLVFGILVIGLIYLISSSAIPKPPLPSSSDFAAWKERKNANKAAQRPATQHSLGGSAPPGAGGKPDSAGSDAAAALGAPATESGTKPVSGNLQEHGLGQSQGHDTSNAKAPTVQAPQKQSATFVTLARNSDLWDIVESIRQVEDRFNKNYHYDWVFLNDKDFDDEFIKVTTALVSGKTRYGLVPEEHWSFPEWIDQEKARAVREDMAARKIIYGDSISYRHMCRFESGFFFRQPLLQEYEWYWRVEPSIKLFCDVGFDPFKFMADNKKIYSFTLSLYEYIETIPTIWTSTKKFMQQHPEHLAADNSMKWLSDDNGETYNRCHFWSNFEIGNLNWLRSKAYTDFFDVLDKDGGFFYERWGDAPVHSIAAGLLLNRDQIHFFDEIGYWHVPFTHCPTDEKKRLELKCACNPKDNFDWKGYSCTNKFFEMNGMSKPTGHEDQKD